MATPDQKAQAAQGLAAAIGIAGNVIGQPIAGQAAQAAAAFVVDALEQGTLNSIVADAQAKADAITTEAAAELADRNRK